MTAPKSEQASLSLVRSDAASAYAGIAAPIAGELASLETRLGELIERFSEPHFPEAKALCAGGKRIRSVLLIHAARAFRNDPLLLTKAVTAAMYVEGIHLCSLLHDDVIDEAEQRRGVSTLHRKYGRTGAILAGDMIYIKIFHHFLHSEVSDVLDVIIDGAIGMVEGETAQTLGALTRFEPTVPEYLNSISRKSAHFFQAAVEAGALLGTRHRLSDRKRRAARVFGHEFGMAFQIVDDVLDWSANQEELGKDLMADIKSSKMTLPLLLFIEEAPETARRMIRRVEQGDAAGLVELAGALDSGGYLKRSMRTAERYAERAQEMLAEWHAETTHIAALLRFAVERRC